MQRQLLAGFGWAIVFLGITASLHAQQPVTVTPTLGTDNLAAGVPTGASPAQGSAGPFYTLTICYFDADGTLNSRDVPVPGIPAAPKNPTPAQAAAASAAKAQAIVAAINAANLPGVTATVDANTQKGQYATGNNVPDPKSGRQVAELKEFDQTTYTVAGTRDSVYDGFGSAEPNLRNKGKKSFTGPTAKLGSGVLKKFPDPTKENGNGRRSNVKTVNPPPPPTKSQGFESGTGSTSGFSTGEDPSGPGSTSVVGFGFIDYSSSIPVDYTVAIDPGAGLNDAAVLGELATIFTDDFGGAGYTATYDPNSDTLMIDQPLSSFDSVWDTNTDTGLDLASSMVDVPEPVSAAAVLVVVGCLLPLRYRRR